MLFTCTWIVLRSCGALCFRINAYFKSLQKKNILCSHDWVEDLMKTQVLQLKISLLKLSCWRNCFRSLTPFAQKNHDSQQVRILSDLTCKGSFRTGCTKKRTSMRANQRNEWWTVWSADFYTISSSAEFSGRPWCQLQLISPQRSVCTNTAHGHRRNVASRPSVWDKRVLWR